jgi:transcriptional antiterminator
MRGVVFENELKLTKQQTAQFLGVSSRAISNCIQNNEEELRKNGYEEISDNRLKKTSSCLALISLERKLTCFT